jgi:hypothetical protein
MAEHMSVNQQESSMSKNCPLPIVDTYANAILRTLSSFKPPSPPPATISLHPSRPHRRSYSHSKTVSQSVVNEVSSLKTCFVYICSSFSHFDFQVEVNGWSTSFFFFSLVRYVIHTGRNDLSAFSEIEYLCMCPYSLFSLGMW